MRRIVAGWRASANLDLLACRKQVSKLNWGISEMTGGLKSNKLTELLYCVVFQYFVPFGKYAALSFSSICLITLVRLHGSLWLQVSLAFVKSCF